jgi:hypothetical protein
VLVQELSPARGGRSVVGTPHIFGDRARTNLEAKTCQLCLDPALPPESIVTSHATDERSELRVSLLTPRSLRPT